MIEESKFCNEVMKKHFNKELVMAKKGNENFKNSTKYWICDNDYIDDDAKVRERIIVLLLENIEALRIEIVISAFKLNHNIPVVFHNLKNYDSRLILQ